MLESLRFFGCSCGCRAPVKILWGLEGIGMDDVAGLVDLLPFFFPLF